MNEKKRTTMYDIADKLNISVGTVHRALHNTGRVSSKTREKVIKTAEKMNFHINQNAQALRRGSLKIGVLLCCPIKHFCDEIKKGAEVSFENLSEFNVFSDIRIMPYMNADQCPDDIKMALHDFCDGTFDAVVLFLSGPTDDFDDSLKELDELSIPVVTVVNDINLKSRIFHVSADGFGAGKLAAKLLGLCCDEERIAILTGSDSTYIHHENSKGFLSESEKANFECVDVFEHQDKPEVIRKQIEAILSSKPAYNGIYITSAGIIDAFDILKDISPEGLPKIVATDLFKENRVLLENNIISATIFQNPFLQGKKAVNKLYQYLRGEKVEEKILIPPQMVFSTNMDYFPYEEQ